MCSLQFNAVLDKQERPLPMKVEVVMETSKAPIRIHGATRQRTEAESAPPDLDTREPREAERGLSRGCLSGSLAISSSAILANE